MRNPSLNVSGNSVCFEGKRYRCAIGKGGITSNKREGDGCTPAGSFPLRACWVRADRLRAPETKLPLHTLTRQDGWCDDAAHTQYNRHVSLPFAGSHEPLWREDGVYDLIVPLGYNDGPVVPGKGSTIFLHVATPEFSGTEGCVALAKGDLWTLLTRLTPNTLITIEH